MTTEEIELEKLRIKRNREKFWVGTVIIGMISLLINSSIQNTKLEHEKIRQDNEHLAKFVTYAISEDFEVRRDIAEYFSTMSYSEDAQKRWGNYLDSVDKRVDIKFSLLNDLEFNKKNRDKLFLQLSEAKLALINDPNDLSLRNKISILTKEIEGKQSLIEEKSQQLQKVQPYNSLKFDNAKPEWLKFAEAELNKNIEEFSGAETNPEILKYSSEIGLGWIRDDEIPWSSQFVNWCLKQAGYEGTGQALNRAFLDWGVPLENPKPGCIIIFWREDKESWKGHVGFYLKDDNENVLVLGGNQRNSISILPYSKERILGYRWPK